MERLGFCRARGISLRVCIGEVLVVHTSSSWSISVIVGISANVAAITCQDGMGTLTLNDLVFLFEKCSGALCCVIRHGDVETLEKQKRN